MDGINSVCIAGHVVRDAEVKATKSGTEITSFSVAVSESRPLGNGEYEDYANFFDVTAFGKLYPKLPLVKGTEVFLQGQLHQSRWESNGQKRSKIEIVLGYGSRIRVLSKEKKQTPPPIDPSLVYAEDIPF